MSMQADYVADPVPDAHEAYRAISKAAVASIMLAGLSLLAFLFPLGAVFSLAGLITGLIGWSGIRRYPMELTGMTAARIGTALSVITLLGATSLHTYIYLTEVPEGYQRISFVSLKAKDGKPDVPPEDAMALDGQKVFIKGYVYPSDRQYGLKQFVLVGDLGTCCFGGQPKLTHMIEVTLADPLSVDYSYRQRKLAGVLKVDTRPKPVSGLQGVYYQLEADYVR